MCQAYKTRNPRSAGLACWDTTTVGADRRLLGRQSWRAWQNKKLIGHFNGWLVAINWPRHQGDIAAANIPYSVDDVVAAEVSAAAVHLAGRRELVGDWRQGRFMSEVRLDVDRTEVADCGSKRHEVLLCHLRFGCFLFQAGKSFFKTKRAPHTRTKLCALGTRTISACGSNRWGRVS